MWHLIKVFNGKRIQPRDILLIFLVSISFSPLQSQLLETSNLAPNQDLGIYTWPVSISMVPTILPGEKFVMDKAYYKYHKISRGNLVAVMVPEGQGAWQIKRVVGIAGDIIKIQDGVLYQNGVREHQVGYLITPFTSLDQNPGTPELFNKTSVRVGKDQIYVLGDHRPAAADSRIWGPLPVQSVIGRPLSIYWSKNSARIGKKLN